ncbi:MAG: prolipoprotein diacylglyceryl transferase [Burkholderiales bacterium]|nr:prolipoprotein diacylglyceryl transferase [Burkholderiales bacterium]
MLVHPQFDPVAFHLGPLAVRWYGLMYLVGFALIWLAGRHRIRARPGGVWTARDLDDAMFHGILGTLLGGRLGYVFFYKFADYAEAPWKILYVWEGGMSFHGGLIGVTLAMAWFAKSRDQDWLRVTDFIAPLVPLALGAGRMGNFINAELWGRPADLPWAMVFPLVDRVPRHPSQLYEFALEGVVLFLVLWWFSSRERPRGAVSAAFLLGYGVFRFAVEYTREPDSFLGLLALGWSMGQWLSAPMVIAGAVMMAWACRPAARAGRGAPPIDAGRRR